MSKIPYLKFFKLAKYVTCVNGELEFTEVKLFYHDGHNHTLDAHRDDWLYSREVSRTPFTMKNNSVWFPVNESMDISELAKMFYFENQRRAFNYPRESHIDWDIARRIAELYEF